MSTVQPRTLVILGIIFIVPILIGMFARTARRATLWSALVVLATLGLIVGSVLYNGRLARGRSPSSILTAVSALGLMSGVLGWFTQKLRAFFRENTPRVAVRQATAFLILSACKLVILLIVIDALGNVVNTDFARDLPEIMYLRWNERPYMYAYVALALMIVCLWGYLYARRATGKRTTTARLVFFRVVPFLSLLFLSMPIFMAWVQVGLAVPLLDCAAAKFPSYVPDMFDYTRLVLDSVANGSMLGLGSVHVATCAPTANIVASSLVLGLKLAPISTVAWLALRAYLIRT